VLNVPLIENAFEKRILEIVPTKNEPEINLEFT